MAQHDYDIANQTFPNFRADLNAVLQAILTNNSGGTAPAVTAAGMIWIDTSGATPAWKVRNDANTGWESFGNTVIPAGTIWEYGGTTAPASWLLCDGAAVSRTDFARLFAAIGTAYGAGDGSTTFNLPNRVNRFGVGAGGTYARGATGGSTTSGSTALTTSQIPSHQHTGTTDGVGDHQHGIGGTWTNDTAQGSQSNNQFGAGTIGIATNTGLAGAHAHSFTTSLVGGGEGHTHTVTPPFIASNYIIKV
jgi:microcystin-dependent protein